MSEEISYSLNIQNALQALEKKFQHTVKKYIDQKETKGQVITETNTNSYITRKPSISHKAQITATFPFIALDNNKFTITLEEILKSQNNKSTPPQIIKVLSNYKNNY